MQAAAVAGTKIRVNRGVTLPSLSRLKDWIAEVATRVSAKLLGTLVPHDVRFVANCKHSIQLRGVIKGGGIID